MNTCLRRVFYLTTAAVGGTGIVLAMMIYIVEPVDEWSVVNHPWQPSFQHAHVLAAPLMVFCLGVLWNAHVLPKWRSGLSDGRRTGVIIAALTPAMVISGYFLQVAVEPVWRTVWEVIHVVSSIAWLVAVALHAVERRRNEHRRSASNLFTEGQRGS